MPSDLGVWAASFDKTDKAAINFFKGVQKGTYDLSEIDDYIANCEASTGKLGNTFKAVGKSMIANLGIMLAITVAVQALSAAFDYLNVTLEEQQEIVDGLQTEIEGLL